VSEQSKVSDFEIVAHGFRLARNYQVQTAAKLREMMREDFPNETHERIDDCLKQLAKRMLERQE
jgi:uncharacterized protein YcbK (DUF882 family)